MAEPLEIYVLSWLISCNLSCAWEFSPFRVHLFSFLNKCLRREREIFTQEDWEYELASHWGAFGEMLMCPLCYGTWLSLAVSLTCCVVMGGSLILPIACCLSFPFLNLSVLKLLGKS